MLAAYAKPNLKMNETGSQPAPTRSEAKSAGNCEKDLTNENLPIIKGQILATLKEEVNIESARELIMAYGLTVKDSSLYDRQRTLLISVPNGKEISWACKFKVNDNFKGSSLNYEPQSAEEPATN